MRYADFLINAGDFKTLQQVAADISKSSSSNLRAYRYLGYAAYENKDYPAGLTAMNTWITKADPKRVIPRDYVYLGRLQIANKQDSLGIQSLRKALSMDTAQADLYEEIARSLFGMKKYVDAAEAYKVYISKGTKVKLTDHLYEGLSYYYGFSIPYASTNKAISSKADTSLLTKADSAFSYVNQKMATYADAYLFRARANDYKETDRNNIKGLAKPFYEKYIEVALAKGPPADDKTKTQLAEAYDYLGAYAEFKDKDQAKAADYFNKAKEVEPTDKQALDYFKWWEE